jgi:hypothetical protein
VDSAGHNSHPINQQRLITATAGFKAGFFVKKPGFFLAISNFMLLKGKNNF